MTATSADLLAERIGPAAPRAARGLDARRCLVCHIDHDTAVVDGRWPPPVRPAVRGTDRCALHGGDEHAAGR